MRYQGKQSSMLKTQFTFYNNEYEPLHFPSAIKPSTIMCEPLPALCKSHWCNIKSCFHFLLQSCEIIRGYTIWRGLQITPVSRQRAPCSPHMLSQLLYLHCRLPLWNNDFRNYVILSGLYISSTLLYNLVLDNCRRGWKGHLLEDSNFEKKKKNHLEKLLGSGRHKLYFFFPRNNTKEDWGHLGVAP